MSTECCICTRPDDLECPSCDKLFCISCFVDHGKTCYEEMKKKAEQKKCSVCGRYASINPTVHCSDCQIEICRSCLYAHRKTHEEEKAKANWRYCVQCGLSKIVSSLDVCSICHGYVCNACKEAHQFAHTKSYARCTGCGKRTTTECDECKKPYCSPCFAKHRAVHEQKKESICPECGLGFFVVSYSWIECPDCHQRFHAGCYYGKHTHKEAEKKTGHKTYRCSGCNRLKTCSIAERAPFWECGRCHEYYCESCKLVHMMTCSHNTYYSARQEYGYNPNDMQDFERYYRLYQNGIWSEAQFKEYVSGRAKEAEERLRKEQAAKEQKAKLDEEFQREKERMNEFFRNFYTGGSWSYAFEEEETDAYKAHYTGQQSQNHSQYSRQQTRTSAPSQELTAAFKLLQLSTRATVQEIKHAFARTVKSMADGKGGYTGDMDKVVRAKELALAHAERNTPK